jgi:hypothetical protein
MDERRIGWTGSRHIQTTWEIPQGEPALIVVSSRCEYSIHRYKHKWKRRKLNSISSN